MNVKKKLQNFKTCLGAFKIDWIINKKKKLHELICLKIYYLMPTNKNFKKK